jgi:hypothetical protein
MVRDYILLAAGCTSVGVVITFIVLAASQRLGLNIFGEYIWVLAIPLVAALVINVILLEIYRKFRKKK